MIAGTRRGGRLDGRVALVTGASRGIGAAVARTYANEGAAVAVAHEPGPEPSEQAEKLVAEIVAAGGQALAIGADLADPDAVDALVASARSGLGPIDVVVNNAAASARGPWHELTVEQWDHIHRVNLRGSWLVARAAYPDLRASEHACVINVTSIMVATGQENAVHYTASKAGLIGFTRAMAREAGTDGIRVNAVMLGAIRTEHETELFPDADAVFARVTAAQSLKRRGFAEDVAGTFLFLASDDSSFMTGQVLNVDGGWAHW
ncbi:SDR family oxidoreductase [Actinobacteria bacterium YIM 96077]|uniref:Short-chain dehydrogenase n=1 Tax=Phytoactinopolyspora halophila TaxID=1981511 RepID=A0A329R025_9ACTN|nr:SDR family oxidoreductase [Phytoactinopolyspora halophila]AYY13257.1 SDR family oxidoreductase [Actinobacteria bacterium YIM 96077]RAW17506.1 short-chain dehydrogenase [Phytoactinopolyspora halophila]